MSKHHMLAYSKRKHIGHGGAVSTDETVGEEERPTPQSKGGAARARALAPKRRKEIGRQAAEVRWAKTKAPDGKLLRATHNGELHIGNVTLTCAVLEDGTRVLSQLAFMRAIGRRGNPKYVREDGDHFRPPEFLAAENLKPFLPSDLESTSRSMLYIGRGGGGRGGVNIGYRAELLPVVCQVYQDARDAGVLHPSQWPMVEACKILYRGFATVGIIALVDEATGYQEVRDRLALQAILDAYLSKELAAWARRFPTEYYQEIFRLREWAWDDLKNGDKVQGPRVLGRYTNDLVYSRLAPGLLEELQERNPVTVSGGRKVEHHRWLTADVGHPALAQHLHAVVGLMRASDSWEQFMTMLNRAFQRRTNLEDLPLFNQSAGSIVPPPRAVQSRAARPRKAS